ncbi:MAG TPA: hypothetical protein VD788_12080 [Candidatus Polarisedimenticolaceae bacterium]|nr:hypothetical protein [Candidatus Polarisedimenticolaceae bacterium]
MSDPVDSLAVDDRARRRGVTLMLVVFVLGLVCGAALSIITVRSVLPRPVARPAFDDRPGDGRPVAGPGARFERMAERLDLDEEQRVRVREILRRSRQEIRDVFETSRQEIIEVLDEEQREEFERMRTSEQRRRRPGGRRGHPDPPPDDGRTQ